MDIPYKISKCCNFIKEYWKAIIIISVPLLLLPLAISGNKPMQCGYVIGIISIFWITEVMNLAVTSLIPIVLFSVFGILTPTAIAACYMKVPTLMIMGCLIVAKTVEKQNLHKRLAIRILKLMGPNPVCQYFGFMMATWFLSMWISNTASTAMMITLAEAVVEQWALIESTDSSEISSSTPILMNKNKIQSDLENQDFGKIEGEEKDKVFHRGTGLFLSITYASLCGGLATPPGTSPNMVFYGFIEEHYGSKLNLNFGTFMLFGFPLSFIFVIFTWLVLSIRYVGLSSIFKRKIDPLRDKKIMDVIEDEYDKLGSIRYGEVSILCIFGILVLLWIIREPGFPLWGRLFMHMNAKGEYVKYWADATSAIFATFLVFILPSENPFNGQSNKNSKLMDWKYIEKCLPWGLLFLFGGGFSLAAGCEASGLSPIIGRLLTNLKSLPHYVIILIISFGISILTEIISNTATVTLLLPIMMPMAECINMHPLRMGLAVTISCSFSFCLPGATQPNAIVFGTGKVRVIEMAISGLVLKIFCVLILSLMTYYYTIPIYHSDIFPKWINNNCTKI